MARQAAYDIHAEWDDPFDHVEDRRVSGRFGLRLKLSITVDDRDLRGQLVGPGRLENVSLTGAYLITKHRLSPGQVVTLAIPTSVCPDHMGMPGAFVGPSTVVRVRDDESGRERVGVRFGEALTQNIEFAVFVDYLRSIAAVM